MGLEQDLQDILEDCTDEDGKVDKSGYCSMADELGVDTVSVRLKDPENKDVNKVIEAVQSLGDDIGVEIEPCPLSEGKKTLRLYARTAPDFI